MSRFLRQDKGWEVSRGQAGGWLRWSAQPLDDAECMGQPQDPAFAPGSSEAATWVSGLCISCCP